MLVVSVDLHNANTGKITRIAQEVIYNDGTGTNEIGNYVASIAKDVDINNPGRIVETPRNSARVRGYKRLNMDVWPLVLESLKEIYDEQV